MDSEVSGGGQITIEDQVIEQYVSDEVLRYDAVSRLVGGITESFSRNILGRDSGSQGVKITRGDGGRITIGIHLIVYYGVNIPQVAYDIQNSVKRVVEEYTGLTVEAVNVSFEGIDRKKEQDE
jgi:uncharacterized alkaline shock family protein YloU